MNPARDEARLEDRARAVGSLSERTEGSRASRGESVSDVIFDRDWRIESIFDGPPPVE